MLPEQFAVGSCHNQRDVRWRQHTKISAKENESVHLTALRRSLSSVDDRILRMSGQCRARTVRWSRVKRSGPNWSAASTAPKQCGLRYATTGDGVLTSFRSTKAAVENIGMMSLSPIISNRESPKPNCLCRYWASEFPNCPSCSSAPRRSKILIGGPEGIAHSPLDLRS